VYFLFDRLEAVSMIRATLDALVLGQTRAHAL
jgi:hypothetical protein